MSRGFNLWATLVVCFFLISLDGNSQTPDPGFSGVTNGLINGTPGSGGGGGGAQALITGFTDVQVVGNYAYSTSVNASQFIVTDISVPQNPVIKAVFTNGTGGSSMAQPFNLFIQGNYAFVAAQGSNALEIIDITNPLVPVHKGKLLNNAGGADLSFARDVFVSGNFAYLAVNTGLEIVNITDKAAPVHKAKLSLPSTASVYVDGRYVYVGGFSSFSVVDIVDPTNPAPVELSTIFDGQGAAGAGNPLLNQVYTIEVAGNYAFIPSYNHNALEILNLTNKSAPAHAASLVNDTDGAIIENPFAVAVSGNYAYVLSGNSQSTIAIVDITNPLVPDHFISVDDQSHGVHLIQGQRLAVVGNYIYTTTTPGLEVDYLFTPTPPTPSSPSNQTQSGFTLNWGAMPTITSFTLDVATDENFTSFVSGFNASTIPGGTYSATLTGLTPASTYYYRLKCTNSNGTSGYSDTKTAETTPGPVQNVHATGSTFEGFTVAWDPIPNVQYVFQYSQGTQADLDARDPDFPTALTSVTLSGALFNIMPATKYLFQVYARNNAGSGPATTIEVYTVPIAPTVSIETTDITQTTVKIGFIPIPGTTGVFLDIAADAAFASMLPGYDNRSLTLGGNTHTTGSIFQPNTTYYVRMRAGNQGGSSVSSDTKTFVTLPGAMTAIAPTLATGNSFRANWNEVPGVSKYWIDVSTTNDFVVKLTSYNNRQVTAPSGGLIVDTGLDPGTTYYYRVRCTNATGDSPNSNVVTAATLPIVPTLNNATAVTLTTFEASWSAPTGATGYFLDVATDAGFTSFVTGFNNKSVGNVTTTTVDGLTASTTYNYRVRASNAGGTTASSAVKTVVTAPPAPVASAATNAGQTSFTANWAAVSGVSDYRIDVSTDNTFATGLAVNNGLVSGTTSFNVTSLNGGTTYYYRVRAINSAGAVSANSNVITQLTVPASPTTVDAASITQTSFTAKWNAVTGATEYFVDVKDDAGVILTGYNNVSVTTGTSLAVSIGIAAGTSYSYVVRARNSTGTSSSSNVQAVLTVPPTPVAIDAAVSGTITFTAKWNAAKSATKYFINVSAVSTFDSKLPGYNNQDVGNFQQTPITVNAPATGATYYYQVSASNASGVSPFSSAITVNTPVVSFPSIILPTGGKVEHYTIISIPAGVTPTTTLSGESFGQTWRIMHYDNATDKNVDVKTVTRETLKIGEGYWVNSNLDQAPTITMTGESQTSSQTITLAKGWNQIGNPFSFGISWADVKAKNPTATGVEDLFVYSAGFSKKDALAGYGGGFVNNTGNAVSLTIPTNVARASRTTSRRHEIEGRDINEDQWFLPLTLESGGKLNDLGGLGMHPQAKATHDHFDAIALPRFFNLSEFSTNHPEFFQPHFMTDVVPTTSSYTWTFNISSEDTDASLSWDNSAWKGATLYLVDNEAGILLDMSKASTYTFDPRRTRSLKFAFGKDGQFTPEVSGLGQPFPNPSTDRVTFPFISQPGQTISINVLDLTGRSVGSMTVQNTRSGYNEAVWEATDTRVSPGVYLYQFTTSTGSRKTGRIVLK